MPIVLCDQHRMTAGVELGANQGHVGGLKVLLVVLLIHPNEIIEADPERTSNLLGCFCRDISL
jgi:hypothetical protein